MTDELLDIEHPGVLLQEILDDLKVTPYRLAQAINKAQIQVSRILYGQSSITPHMSRLLGQALGMSPAFWLNMQSNYDLRVEERTNSIAHIKILAEAAAQLPSKDNVMA